MFMNEKYSGTIGERTLALMKDIKEYKMGGNIEQWMDGYEINFF